MFLLLSLIYLLSFPYQSAANTEKVIFKSPESATPASIHAALHDLDVTILSPDIKSVRLALPVTFPNATFAKGTQSWYFLDNLRLGARYEVRVCWAAVQPTEFWLYTHTLENVFENKSLISDLTSYSDARTLGPRTEDWESSTSNIDLNEGKGHLFLQLYAAADFFTSNQTLMNSPPNVVVDIILDRYLLNIFPESLIPTAIYLVAVAVCSWYAAGFAWRWLHDLSQFDSKQHAEHAVAKLEMSGRLTSADRRHPIYLLPIDLIIMITDRLEPPDFINLAFAHYPLLRHYGLVPEMSIHRLSELIDRSKLPSLFRLLPLPTELLLYTMRLLPPVDMMLFVLANYDDLVVKGIAPPLTDNIVGALRAACQQG